MGNGVIRKKVCHRLCDCVLRRELQATRQKLVSELSELTIESLITDEGE